MKLTYSPRTLANGTIDPAHTVQAVCAACGYDVDQNELKAETCADCGAPLNLKQSVAIQVTTLPPMFGTTL
jgi:hypothetical protein